MSPGPKGALDGAHQSYTIAANDQITAADAYRNIVVAYRNGAPVLLRDVADVDRRPGEQQGRRLVQGQPGDRGRHPAPARRQRHRDRRSASSASCRGCSARCRSGVTLTVVHDRTATIRASIRDVQFTLVLSVGAGHPGGAHLPAHHPRHHHRRRGAAAVADRDLRRDVVLRLLARQPVADGADHRHRLRGRRRHRDDREHRAPHGGRRGPVRGGAQGRERDRLHRHFADACR